MPQVDFRLLPHQQRVVVEHAELTRNINALEAFTLGDVFPFVDPEEQERMTLQLDTQRLLARILAQRIAFFKRQAEAAQ